MKTLMNITKIKPMANYIVTTMDVWTVDEATKGGIVDAGMLKMSVKEHQKVVAVGPMVREIKVGDLVKINPSRYRVIKQKKNSVKDDMEEYAESAEYKFRFVELNHRKYLFISDSDIEYIVEEFEMEEPPSDIIIPNNDLIN